MAAIKTPFGDIGSLVEADLVLEKALAARRDYRMTADEFAALKDRIAAYRREAEPGEEEALRRLELQRGFRAP